jgi:hypothetical protein
MPQFLTVSEVARLIDETPRRISDLFYARRLSDTDCPLVGGRRLIPQSHVAIIAAALGKTVNREAADVR